MAYQSPPYSWVVSSPIYTEQPGFWSLLVYYRLDLPLRPGMLVPHRRDDMTFLGLGIKNLATTLEANMTSGTNGIWHQAVNFFFKPSNLLTQMYAYLCIRDDFSYQRQLFQNQYLNFFKFLEITGVFLGIVMFFRGESTTSTLITGFFQTIC